mmetsp:Transcript_24279/g.60832  ORF Transcript_24279/g.60832 Transcript_24279/m.60832 type:complete len:104 (-) Transcript_24279:202-513(-)
MFHMSPLLRVCARRRSVFSLSHTSRISSCVAIPSSRFHTLARSPQALTSPLLLATSSVLLTSASQTVAGFPTAVSSRLTLAKTQFCSTSLLCTFVDMTADDGG